jgi:outer membrane protein assembly factor BamA
MGIRYNTPVGPLRLDYGQKVHRRSEAISQVNGKFARTPSESPGELHFSIGNMF